MSEKKQYTREEVKKNSTNGNTLLILHDKVYDVTGFLNEHPGGEEILLDHTGKDASEDFDDVGHSTDAFDMMKSYHVGDLVESERTNKKPKKGWTSGYNPKEPENSGQSPGLLFYLLVGGVAVVVAAALYMNAHSS